MNGNQLKYAAKNSFNLRTMMSWNKIPCDMRQAPSGKICMATAQAPMNLGFQNPTETLAHWVELLGQIFLQIMFSKV